VGGFPELSGNPLFTTLLDGRTEKGMYRVVLKGDTIECVEGLQGRMS
jgi:hypothetical protein